MHPAEFRAATRGRKHLAWIEQFSRVERAFEALLLGKISLGELVTHQIPLFDANAVFPAQHTAKIDTGLEDVLTEGFGFLEITRPGRVEHDDRVEIAVAGMEAVGVIQPVPLRQAFHPAKDFRQLATRDGSVGAVIILGDLADSAEGGFTPMPD